jgi:hypothetical protein
MAGELVPLVLLPRYTTLVGAQEFVTVGMDVTDYANAIVNVWRGPLTGTNTPAVLFYFQESTDQVNWTICAGTSGSGQTPGSGQEAQYTATLTKRWFRLRAVLSGTDPAVTCWAVGFLEDRLS